MFPSIGQFFARLFHKLFRRKPKAATTSTARKRCPRP